LDTDQCGCCDGNCPDSSSTPSDPGFFTDFVSKMETVDFIEKFNEEAGLRQVEIVDLSDCPVIVNEPLCAYNANGNLGKWVCRTMFSPITGEKTPEQSICADPQRALVTDQCGCCNGVCPESPCRCPCDLREDGDSKGIRMTVERDMNTTERCVSPKNAIKLTTRYEAFQCIDEC
jgi:hypothetical protein